MRRIVDPNIDLHALPFAMGDFAFAIGVNDIDLHVETLRKSRLSHSYAGDFVAVRLAILMNLFHIAGSAEYVPS